jgi:hypothetical protein
MAEMVWEMNGGKDFDKMVQDLAGKLLESSLSTTPGEAMTQSFNAVVNYKLLKERTASGEMSSSSAGAVKASDYVRKN